MGQGAPRPGDPGVGLPLPSHPRLTGKWHLLKMSW